MVYELILYSWKQKWVENSEKIKGVAKINLEINALQKLATIVLQYYLFI